MISNSYNFLSFAKSECTAFHFSAIIRMFFDRILIKDVLV